MRNIKLTIEYDGANYHGWQRQRNTPNTIQETIEKVLAGILQERVRLIASGRTDAEVHAQAQVANFKTKSAIALNKLKRAANSLLPGDIVITRVQEADLKFHARFNAKSKTYRYTILNQKHPSARWRKFVYFCPYKLDFKSMQRAAKILLGRHDFRCFQASDKKQRGSIRTIKRIKVYKVGNFTPHLSPFPKGVVAKKGAGFIFIDIRANGFVYKMVRNIVGTLIEIGRKGHPPKVIKKTLTMRNRKFAGPTVPGRGLCLLRVQY